MLQRDPSQLYPHDHLMKYTIIPLIPHAITPNMVTIFRMMCTPFVLYFLYTEQFDIGVPLFFLVSLTDAIDGSLARLRHQITDWGTFYDPVADKLLISSVVMLVVAKHINVFFALIILLIEVMIVVGGLLRKTHGKVTSANIFGKTKMCLQVIGVLFLLMSLWAGHDLFIPISTGTLSMAIVFGVISLFTYGF